MKLHQENSLSQKLLCKMVMNKTVKKLDKSRNASEHKTPYFYQFQEKNSIKH